MNNKSESEILWAVSIVILVLLGIAFLISLGQAKFDTADIKAEIMRQRDDLRERHRKLQEIIKEKEIERNELVKLCERVYMMARLLLVVLIVGPLALLMSIGVIDYTIGNLISYVGIFTFLVTALAFIIKGKLSFQEVVSSIKESFENILYTNSGVEKINSELQIYYKEFDSIQTKIDDLNKEILD